MWFEDYVFSLLSNNVVSFAVNVVLSARKLSVNVVSKMVMFAVPGTDVCSSIHLEEAEFLLMAYIENFTPFSVVPDEFY